MSAREPRDNGERPTRPDIVDWDTYDVPDHYPDRPSESVPHAVPDHGRQPRRHKRPNRVAWRRDPNNLYRPAADDFFSSTLHEEPRLSESEQRKIDTVRLLTKTARAHAPKLAWRADDSIAEVIKTEVLPDARFISGSLPPDDIPKVIDKFIEVLWGEIERHRRKRRT
jgi:hypothetical protein